MKNETKIRFTIYFDGCIIPVNPSGHIGYGFWVENEKGEDILNGSFYEEEYKYNTNNVAEYKGLIEGMLAFRKYIQENNIDPLSIDLIIKGDSMLVIKQMYGRWRIKSGYYFEEATEAKAIQKEYAEIGLYPYFQWIPREENEIADDYSIIELYKREIYRS